MEQTTKNLTVQPAKKDELLHKKQNCPEARLTYVTAPTNEQLEGIRNFLKNRYQKSDFRIIEEQDSSIGGGFKLQTDTEEFDWTTKSRLQKLEQCFTDAAQKKLKSEQDIIPILRKKIQDFDAE